MPLINLKLANKIQITNQIEVRSSINFLVIVWDIVEISPMINWRLSCSKYQIVYKITRMYVYIDIAGREQVEIEKNRQKLRVKQQIKDRKDLKNNKKIK